MDQDFPDQPRRNQNVIPPIKWALYIFVASIPLIGLIMLFVWGFSNDNKVNRQNWAKGMLIIIAVAIAFYFLVAMVFGASILAFMQDSASTGGY